MPFASTTNRFMQEIDDGILMINTAKAAKVDLLIWSGLIMVRDRSLWRQVYTCRSFRRKGFNHSLWTLPSSMSRPECMPPVTPALRLWRQANEETVRTNSLYPLTRKHSYQSLTWYPTMGCLCVRQLSRKHSVAAQKYLRAANFSRWATCSSNSPKVC
jgi:hypothetical protein